MSGSNQSASILLDPTAERSPVARARLARPTGIDQLVVGLLDISKARGNVFLDRIDALLHEKGIAVKRYRKPTYTRVAPTALRQQIAAECQLVIEGLAD
jgi:hypothetical protein